jgi:hypothetical protein
MWRYSVARIAGRRWGVLFPQPASRMGDSLAVELPALDRAALVRIQVPQPLNSPILSISYRHRPVLDSNNLSGMWPNNAAEAARGRVRRRFLALRSR